MSTNASKKEKMFKSELVINSNDLKEIEALYQALQPETTIEINPRSIVKISFLNKKSLKITFFADDFASLRAMLSSYLRWIDVALASIRIGNSSNEMSN